MSSNSAWYLNTAQAYAEQGDWDGVFDCLRTILEEDPTLPIVWFQFGMTALRLERYEEARDAFYISLGLGNTSTNCYFNLGAALARLGNLPGAIRAYLSCLKQTPKEILGWYNLGTVYYEQERYYEALAAFDEANGLVPETDELHCDIYLGLGECLLHTNSPGEAESAFKMALDLFSRNRQALIGLAKSYHTQRHLISALDVLDFILEIYPEEAEASQIQKRILEEHMQLDRAF